MILLRYFGSEWEDKANTHTAIAPESADQKGNSVFLMIYSKPAITEISIRTPFGRPET